MTRKKLLLVEDDRALAELLIWHFEREDYEVRRTGDGEEALLLASEDPPDVIILDWMIEGILGLEVCRRLRRRSETSNVPIIMLTARGEESDRIRGLETGADDYVTKPFSRHWRPSSSAMTTWRWMSRRIAFAAPANPSRSGRPSSGCSSISWRIQAASSRANGFWIRSGPTIPTST